MIPRKPITRTYLCTQRLYLLPFPFLVSSRRSTTQTWLPWYLSARARARASRPASPPATTQNVFFFFSRWAQRKEEASLLFLLAIVQLSKREREKETRFFSFPPNFSVMCEAREEGTGWRRSVDLVRLLPDVLWMKNMCVGWRAATANPSLIVFVVFIISLS